MVDTQDAQVTTDHAKIKEWAQEREGRPAVVEGTDDEGGSGGVLRFDFETAGSDEALDTITWNRFFEIFEEKDLAMMYQDETAEGEESRFFKFVDRENVNA